MEAYIYHKKGKKYIKRDKDGNFVHVSSKSSATKFQESTPKRIIQNQFKLSERQYYVIKPIINNDSVIVSEKEISSINNKSSVDENEAAVSADAHDVNEDSLIQTINQLFDGFIAIYELANNIENYETDIKSLISKYDCMKTDIAHYMEFNKLSVVDGYKAYKMAHDLLNKRRAIKNASYKLSVFKNYFQQINTDGLADCISSINSRRYTPRILSELFND